MIKKESGAIVWNAGLIIIAIIIQGLYPGVDAHAAVTSNKRYSVKTKEGIFWVSNIFSTYFLFLVKGESVKIHEVKDKNIIIFNSDNYLMQYMCNKNSDFLKNANVSSGEKDFLIKYMNWQNEYLNAGLNKELKTKHKFVKGKKGEIYIMWEVEFPKELYKDKPTMPKKYLIIARRIKDVAVMFTGVLFVVKDYYRLKKIVEDTAFSISVMDEPIIYDKK